MERRKTIFVVDDQEENCRLIADLLNDQYEVKWCHQPERALDLISRIKPHLILLDYRMPGLDGIQICENIKKNPSTRGTPVIFVSGVATVEERIRALEMGADDFISKPFHAREFELRVRRRLESIGNFQSELTAGALRIDLLSRQVFLSGKEIALTPKQFELLKILVANQNCLVTREIFLKEVWGDTKVSPRNIDSQLNYLKKKLK